jgi:hypothetical protein
MQMTGREQVRMLRPHRECLVRYSLISTATSKGGGGFQKKGLWRVSYICMQRRPNKYLPTISIPPHQHSSIQRIDAPTNKQHFRAQPSCTTRRRNGGVDNDWACMTGCLRKFSRSPCVSLGISNIHGRVYTARVQGRQS